MTRTWHDVWAARTLDRGKRSVLEGLMAADGLDTGFGNVTEEAWRQFAAGVAGKLDATAIYEVGCGAGAFLYPIHERGVMVGGIDQSAALIGYASEAMPDGRWSQGDASAIDPADRWDVVVACGVFMYFADLDYARQVIEKMVAKATRAIAILDVPDLDRKAAALAFRRGSLGEAEYEEKYRGLDHLFYDREWIREALRHAGAKEIEISDQRIDGYQNAQFRFNALARVERSR